MFSESHGSPPLLVKSASFYVYAQFLLEITIKFSISEVTVQIKTKLSVQNKVIIDNVFYASDPQNNDQQCGPRVTLRQNVTGQTEKEELWSE